MKKEDIKAFKDLETLQLKLLQSKNEKEKLAIYIEIKQLLEQIKKGYALGICFKRYLSIYLSNGTR